MTAICAGTSADGPTVDEIEALLPWNTPDQDLAMNLAAWE